jgi:DNA-binding NarL/FixJ family response regulator
MPKRNSTTTIEREYECRLDETRYLVLVRHQRSVAYQAKYPYYSTKTELDTLTEEFEKQVLDRLDLILRVLGMQVALQLKDKSLTSRARILKLAGLDNQTIADVLNTSVPTVRVLTTHLRKVSRRRG